MNRLEVMASGTPNGWKCLAPCIGICIADATSPVLDIGGYAVGLISGNA